MSDRSTLYDRNTLYLSLMRIWVNRRERKMPHKEKKRSNYQRGHKKSHVNKRVKRLWGTWYQWDKLVIPILVELTHGMNRDTMKKSQMQCDVGGLWPNYIINLSYTHIWMRKCEVHPKYDWNWVHKNLCPPFWRKWWKKPKKICLTWIGLHKYNTISLKESST